MRLKTVNGNENYSWLKNSTYDREVLHKVRIEDANGGSLDSNVVKL